MGKPNAKDRILQTAGQLFHERGYSEVGINEIIDKAETAKASFYQHFPSKEALCESWLDSVHQASLDHQKEILAGDETPFEKADGYFVELEEFLIAREFRGCPYSNTKAMTKQGCRGIADNIRIHKEAKRAFFLAICQSHFGETDEAVFAADQLFLLYSGAATESQNYHDTWPVKIARKTVRTIFGE